MEATPNMLLVKWERIRLALNFFMIPQSVLSRQNHAWNNFRRENQTTRL